jgi:hypothetical protein
MEYAKQIVQRVSSDLVTYAANVQAIVTLAQIRVLAQNVASTSMISKDNAIRCVQMPFTLIKQPSYVTSAVPNALIAQILQAARNVKRAASFIKAYAMISAPITNQA